VTGASRLWPWIGLLGTALLSVAAFYLFLLNRQTAVPPSWGSPGGPRDSWLNLASFIFQTLVLTLAPVVLGFLIVRQRPGQRVGWLLLALGSLTAVLHLLQEWTVYANLTEPGLPGAAFAAWVTNWIWVFLFVIVLLILALFPNGRFLSSGWRLAIVAGIALFVVPILVQAMVTTPMASAFQLPNPYFSVPDEGVISAVFYIGVLFMPLTVLLALGQVLARFRRSRGRERQQLKWLLAGIVVMAAAVVCGLALSLSGYVIGDLMVNISVLGPLLGIGVALLRYRLYDIDIIIRRGLLYGLLTVMLVAVYFGLVVLAQAAFVALTGQESPLAIVISTLVIAALFNPLRQRLQTFIDRRFYRRSYDAARALGRFAQTARDEVVLGQLTTELRQVVRDTMQPVSVQVWLKEPERG
jgi:hypothetical protein